MTRLENGQPAEVMWEVTGESEPLDQFVYGASLDGMQVVERREAATLSAGNEYGLSLKSRSGRGSYYFKTDEN